MRNRVFLNGDLDHALLGSVSGLADCLAHFIGLTKANADLAFLVAADDEGAEAETTTALDDFRATINEDDFFSSLLGFPWRFGTGLFSISGFRRHGRSY